MLEKPRRLFSSLFLKGMTKKKRESMKWDSLYRTISYNFRNEELLKQALTHRSFIRNLQKKWTSNERLEFLGDAVLGLIISDELYKRFPESSEGRLTKAKSLVVSREVLTGQAEKIGIGKYLYLGSGEEKSGGRNRKSILSNAYEALLGAIYLDGGFNEARRFVKSNLLKDMDSLIKSKFHHNYKSRLLEYVQGKGGSNPEYRVLYERGPDHKKEFTIEVHVNGKVLGKGKGLSKKRAEQKAAHEAIERLGLETEE